MNFRYFLFYLLFTYSLCHAREVSITILHTTDLHANILPVTDYIRKHSPLKAELYV